MMKLIKKTKKFGNYNNRSGRDERVKMHIQDFIDTNLTEKKPEKISLIAELRSKIKTKGK